MRLRDESVGASLSAIGVRMLQNDKEALVAGAKLGTVWATLGVASWDQAAQMAQTFASFAAGILTLLFICEFLWKKVIRRICYRMGWMEPPKRRETDFAELDG